MTDWEQKAKDWAKDPSNAINGDSTTWVHRVARWLHRAAKLTAFLPQPKGRHTKKPLRFHRQANIPSMHYDVLVEKLYLYTEAMKAHQDKHGFILHEHCDATLFSGLVSGAVKVDLPAARDYLGFWHRRPTEKPCYPKGSASSFSRDMMQGVLWWCWLNKDLKTAQDTLDHLRKNDWVMGSGDPARLVLMPSGEATLSELVHQLGGKSSWMSRRMMQSWPKNLEGYQAHLAVIHCLLRGELQGYITDNMLDMLAAYATKHPYNPLYRYAYSLYTDGNIAQVYNILMDIKLWPAHRLPRRKDRRSDWLNQRDMGADWLPSLDDPEREHSGGDFVHVAWLVIRELENAKPERQSKGSRAD